MGHVWGFVFSVLVCVLAAMYVPSDGEMQTENVARVEKQKYFIMFRQCCLRLVVCFVVMSANVEQHFMSSVLHVWDMQISVLFCLLRYLCVDTCIFGSFWLKQFRQDSRIARILEIALAFSNTACHGMFERCSSCSSYTRSRSLGS